MRKDDVGRLAREILETEGRTPGRLAAAEPLTYSLLARMVDDTRRLGVVLEHYLAGPWRVSEVAPRGVARFLGGSLPTVERGAYALTVRSLGEALDIAALLNWCDVPEPEPA
jgi:hypothetical protein